MNNLIYLFTICAVLFSPVKAFSREDDSHTVASFLGEYGNSQYKSGLVADAVHELKKCLMADRRNKNCRKQLEKIFAGPFKLASATIVCKGEEVIFDATDSYGRLLIHPVCSWDFGDGTSFEGIKCGKSYNKAGLYTVRLTVRDNVGGPFSTHKAKIKIIVYGPSEVDAGQDITICCNNESDYRVTCLADPFRNDTSHLKYFWDFGDGSSGSGRSVKHLYKEAGIYIAKVRVEDAGGRRCSTAEDTLKVRLKIPVKAYAGEDKFAYIGDEVFFDGSESSAKQGSLFTWDFGDKTPQVSGVKVRHIYEKAGKYRVILRVDDLEKTGCSVSENNITATIKSGPTAVLRKVSAVCAGQEVKFDASLSYHPDGVPLIFTWDFGDGNIIEGPSRISHIYEKGGEYTVKVTADDKSASRISRSLAQTKARVNRPPYAVIESSDIFCINKPVVLSGSKSSDPDGDSLKFTWDFGDGTTSSEAKAEHLYKEPGEYVVTLKVDDGSNCASAFTKKNIKIEQAVSLNLFQDEVKKCILPAQNYSIDLDFDKIAHTNLNGARLLWDFGDGSEIQGRRVTHTYKAGGKHTASLKVDNGKSLPCSTAAGKFIIWLNKPPVASISPNSGCCVNEEYNFNAAGSFDPEGDSLTYSWDFGDGSTSKGPSANHVYKKGGAYKVKLTVDDGSGFGCSSATSQSDIYVNEKPVASFKAEAK